MTIKEKTFKQDLEYLNKLESEIAVHALRKRQNFDLIYTNFEKKLQLKEEMDLALNELKTIRGGQFNEELECRKRVLRRLGYVDNHTITQKGNISRSTVSVNTD